MRQSTVKLLLLNLSSISKLPMRQSTMILVAKIFAEISKLPMRQSTNNHRTEECEKLSKLPMRQSTAEESERASAPSRENPSPSILPKVSTGRKKSR